MKKIFVLVSLIFLLVGCENASKESNNKVDNNNENSGSTSTSIVENNQSNSIENKPVKYEIKKEDINEKEFIIDPEINDDGSIDCHLFFMDDKAYYFDGFGNTIRGEYVISGDRLQVSFKNFIGDYSEEPQELDVRVPLKMTDENTILVEETPSPYMLKTSTLTEAGEWVFDGGEKEMTLLGLVEGYHFYKVPVVPKLDDSKEWVYDAEYEMDLKAPSYIVWEKEYFGKDIVVPFINIDSDYAREANEEIKATLDIIVKHYNEGVKDNVCYVDSCSYTR